MVINIKVIKDSIEIKCNPIVPSKFKYQLLDILNSLYTLKIDGNEKFEKLEKSEITEDNKIECLKFYEQNNFNYSFEDFLDLTLFPIGTVEIFSKEDDKKIAFIDFVPDGDVNIIWIDIYHRKSKNVLFELIRSII